MLLQTLLTAFIIGIFSCSFASPLALAQSGGSGANSCDTEPLNAQTWSSLDMETFLILWTYQNVTPAETNNIQALADSFGAPNFFCGLDSFCNAGQPCSPVGLPAWYALVAIQNWNNYMNSLNSAIIFGSNIIGLTVPSIVTDFYPEPKPNITPLDVIIRAFTVAIYIVPFTGYIPNVRDTTVGAIVLSITNSLHPHGDNRFVDWSDISASLATVVQQYQAALSSAIKTTIDAPVNDTSAGIIYELEKGDFLGIAQNFSQTDLQDHVTDTIKVYSISLVLQAQKIFVYRKDVYREDGPACDGDEQKMAKDLNSVLCVQDTNDSKKAIQYELVKVGRDTVDGPDVVRMEDTADLLISKYGFKKRAIPDSAGAVSGRQQRQAAG